MPLSAQEHQKSFVTVNGKKMAYVDLGSGPTVLFLHGNPTSSYLWRNIMPYVSDDYRAIAPDLIGMGDSEKLDDPGPQSYRFVEHRDYLNGFVDVVVPDGPVVLVIHDWGSALGFDWARRNPDRVKGICFMEAIIAPVPDWDAWPEAARGVFQGFRSEAGEEMVLEKNVFIEAVLPGSILRKLTDEEMEVYRRPFKASGEDRRPTLTWPRQIPIAGEPEDVVQIVSDYAAWLPTTDFPKLFVDASPGAILGGKLRDFVRTFKNQTEIQVAGSHFIQEDSPDQIGEALAGWLAGIDG
ncbi:MAG: haloalkane dehalogenase [Pseudomonadota bacterium]